MGSLTLPSHAEAGSMGATESRPRKTAILSLTKRGTSSASRRTPSVKLGVSTSVASILSTWEKHRDVTRARDIRNIRGKILANSQGNTRAKGPLFKGRRLDVGANKMKKTMVEAMEVRYLTMERR